MNEDITGRGTVDIPGFITGPYEEHSNKDQANQVYGQYTVGNLRVDAEYRRWWRDQQIFNGFFSVTTDTRGWYTSASYRISSGSKRRLNRASSSSGWPPPVAKTC